MDKHRETHESMNLDKFLTCTMFDSPGEVLFLKCFGFIKAGCNVGGSITNFRILG